MASRILSARRALVCVAVGAVAGSSQRWLSPPASGPLSLGARLASSRWCGSGASAGPTTPQALNAWRARSPSSHLTDDAIITACLASIAAVVVALTQSSKQAGDAVSVALVILGVLGTMVAWALVNTVYAFKYARMYFVDHREGGFDFNQDSPPTYSDFAYLAFTIGMSYTVADIEPNSSDIRRKALPHALLSYLFGTVLIAVAINLVTDLGQS